MNLNLSLQAVNTSNSPAAVDALSAGQCVTLALSACTAAGCSVWNAPTATANASAAASVDVCTPSDRPVGGSDARLVGLDATSLSVTLAWSAPSLWNGVICRCAVGYRKIIAVQIILKAHFSAH